MTARPSRTARILALTTVKKDNQALLKAKYYPQVAAASRTPKTPPNPCDLDF